MDIIRELQDYGVNVQVHDPLTDAEEAPYEYGVDLIPLFELRPSEAVMVAIAHKDYYQLFVEKLKDMMNSAPLLVDEKGVFSANIVVGAGIKHWRL